jgi:tyrosine-specific transport protein
MNLFVTEITLRTKKEEQIVALAQRYLGKTGKYLMLASVVIGMFGALTAYTVAIGGIGELMSGFPDFIFFLLLTILAYFIISKGVKMVCEVESLLITVMLVFILIIILLLGMNLNVANLTTINLPHFFLPYGAIFFALMSYSVMPEVEVMLKGEKNKMYKASIYAMVICTVIYALFSMVFISEFGINVAEIATESLTGLLGIVGNLVAVLTMSTSYIAIGMVLRNIIGSDLGFGKNRASIIVCAIPFIIAFLIQPGFLNVIGATGAYTGSLTGILLCIMFFQARKHGDDKPEAVVRGGSFLVYLLIFFFVLGIIMQTISLFF